MRNGAPYRRPFVELVAESAEAMIEVKQKKKKKKKSHKHWLFPLIEQRVESKTRQRFNASWSTLKRHTGAASWIVLEDTMLRRASRRTSSADTAQDMRPPRGRHAPVAWELPDPEKPLKKKKKKHRTTSNRVNQGSPDVLSLMRNRQNKHRPQNAGEKKVETKKCEKQGVWGVLGDETFRNSSLHLPAPYAPIKISVT